MHKRLDRGAPLREVEVLRVVVPVGDAEIEYAVERRDYPGAAPRRGRDVAERQAIELRLGKAGLRADGREVECALDARLDELVMQKQTFECAIEIPFAFGRAEWHRIIVAGERLTEPIDEDVRGIG